MQTLKKNLKWLLIVVLVLGLAYWFGPKVAPVTFVETMPQVANNPTQVEADIANSEKQFDLKPDNQARIVWADSTQKRKTKYSLVYIHGFGASWAEGEPVHRLLAKKFGCNLYLARLHDAGIKDREAFDDLTPQNFYEGAKRALAVGQAIGDSVIIMGCSAGGLLTLQLAANHPEIKAIMLYSPCLDIFKSALKPATGPWGKQILGMVSGTARDITHYKPDRARYWLTRYRTEGLMTLQQSMDAIAKTENYVKIKMPVWLGYYYKDEAHQDEVVSVAAMLSMYDALGTPAQSKAKVAFPESGDHVIASFFTSKDIEGVRRESERFLEKTLNIKPVLANTP